ncbi:hypothetical protein CAEBREN_00802 [Caenorhabditis brenneri]|uniref:Zinc metalloproteinase n=1 Tax=Caenorhabditis brenneri TaxID=135651 RepID=G0P6N6_CAEBE|nr:hypothetical protein CAEBREN_00802 [Caenorhabditis brenneri]
MGLRLILFFLIFCVFLTFESPILKHVNEVTINEGRKDIIDGEIAVSEKQMNRVKEGRTKRQVTKTNRKWPNATIFYYFESTFRITTRELIVAAIYHISSRTCIKFKESSTATNRIKFINGDCASYVGMNGGEQGIWFSSSCNVIGSAVHEIMHALGIYHTQSRYDRDRFLTLNLSLVPEIYRANMNEESPKTTLNAVPYEYASTLHYSADSFDYGFMLPREKLYTRAMGLRRVTFYDMVNINALYSCGCSKEMDCKNGGYSNPSNCSECVCPEGFGGTLCDESPPNSVHLTAAPKWKGYWIGFGYEDYFSPIFTINLIFITAPADKTIQVQITEMTGFSCTSGCYYDGIEIKVKGDPRITNPVFCCKDDEGVMNTIHNSKQNPLPIVLFTRYYTNKVTIQYRYVDVPLSKNNLTTNGYDNFKYYE